LRIPCFGIGEQSTAKTRFSARPKAMKNKKTPALTRDGNSNDMAHCSIIYGTVAVTLPCDFKHQEFVWAPTYYEKIQVLKF